MHIFKHEWLCANQMIIYIKQANSQYINDTQGAAVFGAPHRKGTDEGKQRREHYRFKELAASEFPYQVKLFPEISDLSSLSSILTDDDDYNCPQQTGIWVHMQILKPLSI